MRAFAGALILLVAAVASAAPVQTAPHDPLLWSDGAKPTAQAISLLRELRQCAERGLDPEDYPLDRLANQLAVLTGATQSAAGPAAAGPAAAATAANPAQWAAFDAELTRTGGQFISDLHYGRVDPAAVRHNLADRPGRSGPAGDTRARGRRRRRAGRARCARTAVQALRIVEATAGALSSAGESGRHQQAAAAARQIGKARRGLCRRSTAPAAALGAWRFRGVRPAPLPRCRSWRRCRLCCRCRRNP